MNTRNFNFIDKIIANFRLNKVLKYVDYGDKILDFGCGSHSFLLSAAKNIIASGVGLDYEIKNGKQGNIDYVQYEFNGRLPFKDKSFDKIFLLAVLEHIKPENVEKLFNEFKRILKNNGKIILTTPTPGSKIILEFLAYKIKIISREEILDHKKYYKKIDFEKIGRNTELSLVDYKFFQFGLNSRAILKKSN